MLAVMCGTAHLRSSSLKAGLDMAFSAFRALDEAFCIEHSCNRAIEARMRSCPARSAINGLTPQNRRDERMHFIAADGLSPARRPCLR